MTGVANTSSCPDPMALARSPGLTTRVASPISPGRISAVIATLLDVACLFSRLTEGAGTSHAPRPGGAYQPLPALREWPVHPRQVASQRRVKNLVVSALPGGVAIRFAVTVAAALLLALQPVARLAAEEPA